MKLECSSPDPIKKLGIGECIDSYPPTYVALVPEKLMLTATVISLSY